MRANIFTCATHHMDTALAYRLWENGLTDKEIAEACKVHRDSVARWRQKNKYPPNKKDRKKSAKPTELAQVNAEARANGMTYGQWMAKGGMK